MKIIPLFLCLALLSVVIFTVMDQEVYGTHIVAGVDNLAWHIQTASDVQPVKIRAFWDIPWLVISNDVDTFKAYASSDDVTWTECVVFNWFPGETRGPTNSNFPRSIEGNITCEMTEPINHLKIIAIGFSLIHPEDENINTNPQQEKKKGNGGCADCIPPTLGLDKNFNRVVDYGFGYNGNLVQVDKWYTDFPKINVNVGEENLLQVKVFENNGISNMKWIQACFGASERGMPLNDCEVLVTVHLETNGTTDWIGVDKVVIVDEDNLLDNETILADVSVVNCHEDDHLENPKQCVNLDLKHTFLEAPLNNMVIINVADKSRNPQNFHFNHGIEVHGESLNGQPTITKFEKYSAQDITDNWITYTRTDKRTDMWNDENGIEYYRINENFVRITPLPDYVCNDTPLDQIMNGGDRNNCHWRADKMSWLWQN